MHGAGGTLPVTVRAEVVPARDGSVLGFFLIVVDRTGTRRAVTVIDSECATVVRSDDGYGLGFAWLER